MYREPGIFPADPIPVLIAVSHACPRTVGSGTGLSVGLGTLEGKLRMSVTRRLCI